MTIWILNHYAGTSKSPSTRHIDLSKELVKKKHKVTIFASSYNYQKLIEERLNSGEKWQVENYEGVKFIWIKTFPYSGNDWRRLLNMLSYTWRTIWVGKKFKEIPDVIIGSSVHPFAALSAFILSIMKGSIFFFEVRDLWPQTLIDMGALSEKSALAFGLRTVEKFLYRKAKKIITLLPYADRYITNLGISRDKIVWIPNGADLSRYKDIKEYNGVFSDQFKIMYLGAHGRANALDVILNAAYILQKKGFNNIKFIFVGDGPEKQNLITQCIDKSLVNVEFHDLVPKNEIFKIMGEADAFVFNLEDSPVFRYGISSNKLFDYMASGRPILFSANAPNNPVAEADAGISVPPRDPQSVADAVIRLVSMSSQERKKLGINGIAYVKKYHEIKSLAEKLEATLSAN